jgi:hypothetical protein
MGTSSAILRIGGPRLYAEGLLLERARVYMDRSVVRRLERDGYVEFHEGRDPYFAISTKGEQLIAQDFLGLISGASGHQ